MAKPGTFKFEIKNRWTGKVIFTADLGIALESESLNIQLGAAVKFAYASDADLRRADLRDAVLSGADLSRAVLSGADLSRADLSDAVLSRADLRDADLRGADLSGVDLSRAVLSGADLRDAVLSGVDLEKLKVEDLDGKMLAAIKANKAAGTNGLAMDTWHGMDGVNETNWCETTHCRAGYAICIVGKDAFDLEKKLGPGAVGALIYAMSYPDMPIPNFYASNEEAMADIRARAALTEKSA